MADKPTPDLRGIPPELRNRIYHLVLVSDKPINVADPKNMEQPALLRTCRQLRNEAITIYYTANTFSFTVCNYDGAAMLPFCQMLGMYGKGGNGRAVKLDYCPYNPWPVDFRPLRAWLRTVHANTSLMPIPAQDQPCILHMTMDMAMRLFGVVVNMRAQPWKQVSEVLENFLYAMENMQGDSPPDQWGYNPDIEREKPHICSYGNNKGGHFWYWEH